MSITLQVCLLVHVLPSTQPVLGVQYACNSKEQYKVNIKN